MKTINEALSELKTIAKGLGVKINNGKVLSKYFQTKKNEEKSDTSENTLKVSLEEKRKWWNNLSFDNQIYLIGLYLNELDDCMETTYNDVEIMYEHKDEI